MARLAANKSVKADLCRGPGSSDFLCVHGRVCGCGCAFACVREFRKSLTHTQCKQYRDRDNSHVYVCMHVFVYLFLCVSVQYIGCRIGLCFSRQGRAIHREIKYEPQELISCLFPYCHTKGHSAVRITPV